MQDAILAIVISILACVGIGVGFLLVAVLPFLLVFIVIAGVVYLAITEEKTVDTDDKGGG